MDLKRLNTKTNPLCIRGKYVVQERLGGGSFGQIYSAVNKSNKSMVAIKFEQRLPSKNPTLPREAKIMSEVADEVGFPPVHSYGKEDELGYLVMGLLGLNLEKLLRLCGRQFSLKTVLMLADQMLTRIEVLHQKGYLHRDIKPENFCIGNEEDDHHLFLIDFGLARSYKENNGQHIAYRDGKSLVGTARYASINTHLGVEQSRRDDLESIGYTLIYFMKGELPWQNIKTQDKLEKYRLIAEKKLGISVEELCADLPMEFVMYMNYVRSLGFTDAPNYKYLKKLFRTLFIQNNFTMDYNYDWYDVISEQSSNEKRKKKQSKVSQVDFKTRSKKPEGTKEGDGKNGEEAKAAFFINSKPFESSKEAVGKEENIVTGADKRPSRNGDVFAKTKVQLTQPGRQSKTPQVMEISLKNGSTNSGDSSKLFETGPSDNLEIPGEFTERDFPSWKMEHTKSLIGRNRSLHQKSTRIFVSMGFPDESLHQSKVLRGFQTCPTNYPNDDSQMSRMKRSDDFGKKETGPRKSFFRVEEDFSEGSICECEEGLQLALAMQQKIFFRKKLSGVF